MSNIKSFGLAFMAILLMGAGFPAPKKQYIPGPENNVTNPGMENGSAGYSGTGASVISLESATPLKDKRSLKWDPSATGEFLTADVAPITEGQLGRSCSVEMTYKWVGGTSGQIELQAYDGANILSSTPLVPTTAASPSETARTGGFDCPAGTVDWRLASTANATEITVESVHVGRPTNEFQVDSAEVVFDGQYSTEICTWSRTSTTMGAFTPDANCSGITVNKSVSGVVVDATDDNLPTNVFSSLKRGAYTLTVTGTGLAATASAIATFGLSDDGFSTTLNAQSFRAAQASGRSGFSLIHTFDVTSDGTAKTFELGCQSSSGACQLFMDSQSGASEKFIRFVLERKSLSSSTTVSLGAQSGRAQATHGTDCLFTTSSATYTQVSDATCTFAQTVNENLTLSSALITANPTTGIRFTPKRLGVFKVYANVNIDTGAATQTHLELRDTASVVKDTGGFDATAGSGSSSQVDLVGEIIASDVTTEIGFDVFFKTSSGSNSIVGLGTTTKAITWRVEFQGQSSAAVTIVDAVTTPECGVGCKTVSAEIDMPGTPAVTTELGSWIDTITDTAVGRATINLNAGVFGTLMHCTCVAAAANRNCVAVKTGVSSVEANIQVSDTAAFNDTDFDITCHGK